MQPGFEGELPRWRLDSIYPSFDSSEYLGDLEKLDLSVKAFLAALEEPWAAAPEELSRQITALIQLYEAAGDLEENLQAYGEAVYTTDTRDSRAIKEINALEKRALPLGKAVASLRKKLAELEDILPRLEGFADPQDPLGKYRFFIEESIARARFQMDAELEDLANDLARSGGDAWSRLHGSLSSVAAAPFRGENMTATALRNLAHSEDREVREEAYLAELAAWKSVETPLAAALNGVKGTSITLDARRGWGAEAGDGPGAVSALSRALKKSAFQSRMSGKTLESLIAAIESSLPMFRRYLKTKAALLGKPSCAFFDLFAPIPGDTASRSGKRWTWRECAEFIPQCFDAFDPGMGAFARNAFALSWIDAEGREGKTGGAYCVDFPLAGESRILCNFEGSFDSVTTVAHELGHGWHHELIKAYPRCLSGYPMTLAETASIFAETIVFEKALEGSPEERLPLIEGNLKDCCQVLTDILSRFYFERELFTRREQGELNPEELCAMMMSAQEKTYGDGLDPRYLHPYMWAVKGHYYSPGLAFYNYPYAFGLLFSLGLYAEYQSAGSAFAASYRELLRLTGGASAETVAASAGFSIEGPEFWRGGLDIIARRIGEFEQLAHGRIGTYEGRKT